MPNQRPNRWLTHFHPPNPHNEKRLQPMVLLLGQYSVGKTSFIRSLLKRDFPGQRVGPEPTTDRFMAVMYGNEERLVPGHALAMQVRWVGGWVRVVLLGSFPVLPFRPFIHPSHSTIAPNPTTTNTNTHQADKPFRGVAAFGNNFLTKFEAAEVPAAILRNITLIDSPGILSGEKQRLGRDYDYQVRESVCRFAGFAGFGWLVSHMTKTNCWHQTERRTLCSRAAVVNG